MGQNDMWAFYSNLDREVKVDFMVEVLNETGWSKSTFYTRMQDQAHWTKLEAKAVLSIYEKYKKQYSDEM